MQIFEKPWEGKTALVTGATQGIGKAVVEAFLARGLRVVAAARDMERLKELQKEWGEKSEVIQVDLRESHSIRSLFQQVKERFGGVEVLVNNAGLGYEKPLTKQSEEEAREMLEVNVMALNLCSRYFLDQMQGKPKGQIVNVSSVVGHRMLAASDLPFYAVTKHAVTAFTEGLRSEVSCLELPVRVGQVSPGMVETQFRKRSTEKEKKEGFYASYPPLQPKDVAAAVVFILEQPPHAAVNDIIMRAIGQVS